LDEIRRLTDRLIDFISIFALKPVDRRVFYKPLFCNYFPILFLLDYPPYRFSGVFFRIFEKMSRISGFGPPILTTPVWVSQNPCTGFLLAPRGLLNGV
jgi:hypothetical protein